MPKVYKGKGSTYENRIGNISGKINFIYWELSWSILFGPTEGIRKLHDDFNEKNPNFKQLLMKIISEWISLIT